jgi:hypothetical protein
MPELTRREFIAFAPALFLAPTLIRKLDAAPVRLALVYSPPYEPAVRAARVSAGEVQRAAALLKREFDLTVVKSDELVLDGSWSALIVATAQPINAGSLTVVDISGSMPCGPHVLKLRSSAAQCADQRCAVWHHSLERYGAGQLNDRFRAAGITPIDDQAWLGWFAVKCLWEAGVRDRAPRDMTYDGHKGIALRFNQAGELMQPLYVIDGDKVVKEIKPDAAMEAAACDS